MNNSEIIQFCRNSHIKPDVMYIINSQISECVHGNTLTFNDDGDF